MTLWQLTVGGAEDRISPQRVNEKVATSQGGSKGLAHRPGVVDHGPIRLASSPLGPSLVYLGVSLDPFALVDSNTPLHQTSPITPNPVIAMRSYKPASLARRVHIHNDASKLALAKKGCREKFVSEVSEKKERLPTWRPAPTPYTQASYQKHCHGSTPPAEKEAPGKIRQWYQLHYALRPLRNSSSMSRRQPA